MRQIQTEREKKIAGIRLENLIKEKNVTRRDVIQALNLQGHTEFTEQKMSDYISGRRPIPQKYAEDISKYLNTDIDFLTDTTTFHAFVDNTYHDYIESKNLSDLIAEDFYIRYKRISALFGYTLGVHSNGNYELSDNNGFKRVLSKTELHELYDDIFIKVHEYISEHSKEGDPLD